MVLEMASWAKDLCVSPRLDEKLKEAEALAKEERTRAIETAAENRVLIATLRAMQDECHAAKVDITFASNWWRTAI
jgi:hypothetical protein